jgi:phosphonate transport system substrate-binding protein
VSSINSERHPWRHSRSRRPSTGLFLVASVTTVLALGVGSIFMWALYQTSVEVPGVGSPVAGSNAKPPLVVGVARTPGGPAEWTAYASVFAELQRDLGQEVRLRYALDRRAMDKSLLDGTVDLAFVPDISYIQLMGAGAATLVAAPIIDSASDDAAVMVVAQESSFRGIEDLKGRRLLLTPGSLGGEASAYWFLERLKSSPDAFFGSVITSNEQDTNLSMVANGQADATCVNRSDLASWPGGTFRIVAQSPEFGMPPIVARQGLGAETIDAVRRSLLSVAKGGVIPTDSAVDGFSVPNDSDYDFARVLMRYESKYGTRVSQVTR